MKQTEHVPVLLETVLERLDLCGGETVVDATLGGGGYTEALLERVGSRGRVIALDADPTAIARYQAIHSRRDNLTLVHANFAELAAVLDRLGITRVDAVVADLGFSSDQMNDPKRGFSFQDGPLDMRLDPTRGETAAELLNRASAPELETIFRRYGDEPHARRIAHAIVKRRAAKPWERTQELAHLIRDHYPVKAVLRQKIHPATRVFQAVRIAINDELGRLEAFLAQATDRLALGGTLAIVAFHSGEDRLVKNFFRDAARSCVCPPGFPVCTCARKPRLKILTKKALAPSPAEVARNQRARSAKLRLAQKL